MNKHAQHLNDETDATAAPAGTGPVHGAPRLQGLCAWEQRLLSPRAGPGDQTAARGPASSALGAFCHFQVCTAASKGESAHRTETAPRWARRMALWIKTRFFCRLCCHIWSVVTFSSSPLSTSHTPPQLWAVAVPPRLGLECGRAQGEHSLGKEGPKLAAEPQVRREGRPKCEGRGHVARAGVPRPCAEGWGSGVSEGQPACPPG